MSTKRIPHNAFIVVADGVGARFFRNSGKDFEIALVPDGDFKPSHLEDDGPSGHRPPESSDQDTDEATFAKQLAHELYRRVHAGGFDSLALIADPRTLGRIRPLLHKEVQDRVVSEIHKSMTKATLSDIQKSLNASTEAA